MYGRVHSDYVSRRINDFHLAIPQDTIKIIGITQLAKCAQLCIAMRDEHP